MPSPPLSAKRIAALLNELDGEAGEEVAELLFARIKRHHAARAVLESPQVGLLLPLDADAVRHETAAQAVWLMAHAKGLMDTFLTPEDRRGLLAVEQAYRQARGERAGHEPGCPAGQRGTGAAKIEVVEVTEVDGPSASAQVPTKGQA